jgi:hypothetical protein
MESEYILLKHAVKPECKPKSVGKILSAFKLQSLTLLVSTRSRKVVYFTLLPANSLPLRWNLPLSLLDTRPGTNAFLAALAFRYSPASHCRSLLYSFPAKPPKASVRDGRS